VKEGMPLILARACLTLLHHVKIKRTRLEVVVVGLHAPVEKTNETRRLVNTQRAHATMGALVLGESIHLRHARRLLRLLHLLRRCHCVRFLLTTWSSKYGAAVEIL
jgi:hypothetical protein